VSAFYTTANNEVYSIGQQSANPIFRGKKLVLNYTSGSLCPELDENGRPQFAMRKVLDGDEDDQDRPPSTKPSKDKSPSTSARRKSTLLSFQCDRDPLLTDHPQISFVGSPDHCTYFFEVRSRYACGGAISSGESGSLGPGGVFAVILAITVLVYLIGGCVYQRSVMHQRGWRQCPNYGVWAGFLGFIGVSRISRLVFASFARRSRKKMVAKRKQQRRLVFPFGKALIEIVVPL
jgi:cation-dependent mannose-6-phosphate receptor